MFQVAKIHKTAKFYNKWNDFLQKLLISFIFLWYRKPLSVYGARQVGKTYSIIDFCKKYYNNIVYFNFEGNSPLLEIFIET